MSTRAEYQRNRRAMLRASGLCVDCLGPNDREQRNVCSAFSTKNVARQTAKKLQRRAAPGYVKPIHPAKFKKTHGESFASGRTPEYVAWSNIISRCYVTTRPEYKNYGGRGISVHSEWRASFEAFLRDVGRRPSAGHSIDRIDVDGNYEPGNVRWATSKEQNRNRRNNRTFMLNGERICLVELEERFGVPRKAIQRRISKGIPVEQAVQKRCA